jgi:hypothetical protein
MLPDARSYLLCGFIIGSSSQRILDDLTFQIFFRGRLTRVDGDLSPVFETVRKRCGDDKKKERMASRLLCKVCEWLPVLEGAKTPGRTGGE